MMGPAACLLLAVSPAVGASPATASALITVGLGLSALSLGGVSVSHLDIAPKHAGGGRGGMWGGRGGGRTSREGDGHAGYGTGEASELSRNCGQGQVLRGSTACTAHWPSTRLSLSSQVLYLAPATPRRHWLASSVSPPRATCCR